MDSQQIRREFLDYFQKRGHNLVLSSPLTPVGDPSMLFTTAGMVQFKPVFAGLKKIDYKTAVSCQKCLRTSDIDRVGKTLRHHTFFEMLGNFSFGDYFKEGAIEYCWDFITNVMGISAEPLWVSVYEQDEEAEQIWTEHIGLQPERVVRLGKKDNFWGPAGATGACGPCSELYIDLGKELGCGKKNCKPGCDCDRFVEIWNLVFPQYNCDEHKKLTPLPKPGIDTGMGLERLAMVMQKTGDPYLTDLFQPTIKKLEKLSAKKYSDGGTVRLSMRIIADHTRALLMALSEGILPANDGQGYVLRRLLRRASLHGNRLGIKPGFLSLLIPTLVDVYSKVYPEVKSSEELACKTVESEETNFERNLQAGLSRMEKLVEETKSAGQKKIAGKDIFLLHDTYGFPLEMSQELAEEAGLEIDLTSFKQEMEKARQRSRAQAVWEKDLETGDIYESLEHFVGWDQEEAKSEVLEIITEQGGIKKLQEGDSGELVLSPTPFYATAGGQVSDTGELTAGKTLFQVEEVRHLKGGRIGHRGKLLSGELKVGQELTSKVDLVRRSAIERAHTATHLLHWALREVMGATVKQAGSLVQPDELRFDYTSPEQPTDEQIQRVAGLVNEKMLANIPLTTEFMSLSEAKKAGVTALFTEKYGEQVRVVRIGEISAELCGGTHLNSTGEVGSFYILTEGSVSAGVRRIEGVTGLKALEYVRQRLVIIKEAGELLKSPGEEIVAKISNLREELREKEKELAQVKDAQSKQTIEDSVRNREEIGPVKIIVELTEETYSLEQLRIMIDETKRWWGGACGMVLFASLSEQRLIMVAGITEEAISHFGLSAGDVISKATQALGGKGGGRKDFAQGGVKVEPSEDTKKKFEEAKKAVLKYLTKKILG